MVQVNTTEEAVHRIAVFGAAQDGQLYTLFKLLDELPNIEERNKAINTVCGFSMKLFLPINNSINIPRSLISTMDVL